MMTVMNYHIKLACGNFWFIVPNLISSLMVPTTSEVYKLKVTSQILFPPEIIHKINSYIETSPNTTELLWNNRLYRFTHKAVTSIGKF